MDIEKALGHCRWFFFRAGFLYVLVLAVALMCVDVPGVVRSIRIRRINDVAADLPMLQLVAFAKQEIPASKVDWKAFTAYFRMILQVFPSQEVSEMFLGLCEYYGFGREDSALQHLRNSANNLPVVFWNLYDTGVLLFKKGDMVQASYYLERALLVPGQQVMFAMTGSIAYRQFMASGASGDLLARLNKARENALLLLAAAHFYKQDYDKARIFAMKGLSELNAPGREPFYFFAGAIAMRTGDAAQALSLFYCAIKDRSENPLTYRYAAQLLKAAGKGADADKISAIALRLEQQRRTDGFPYPERLRLEFF